MNYLQKCFLENQRDLSLDWEFKNASKTSQPPPKCKHKWDSVDMTSMCWKCGRTIIRPIDSSGGDFDAWNSGRLYGKVERFPQPQCSIKTIRNHQCTHPCRPGKNLCRRHFNLAKKKGTVVDTPSDWERRLNLSSGAWERFT